jgi:hypothetical protein
MIVRHPGDRSCMKILAAILGLALICGHTLAEEEVVTHRRPVKVIADARITVGSEGKLPLYVSGDWSNPLPGITRAVLVLHGRLRDADAYERSARTAQAAAGEAGRTTRMIVPQALYFHSHRGLAISPPVCYWSSRSTHAADVGSGPVAQPDRATVS